MVGLVVFGSVVRAGQSFVIAGLVTFLPAAPVMGLFWLLPDPRGLEPEVSGPTRSGRLGVGQRRPPQLGAPICKPLELLPFRDLSPT